MITRSALEPDLVMLDLDGVVYHGSRAVVGAVPALRDFARRGLPYAFLTNNASRSPETVAEQIAEYGVPVHPAQVRTSAQAVAQALAQRLPVGDPVAVFGAPALAEAVDRAGLRAVQPEDLPSEARLLEQPPAAIAMGYSAQLRAGDLRAAISCVRAGAGFWATNPDPSVPGEHGVYPGNGTFVDIVERFTGVPARIAGKPAPVLPQQVISEYRAVRPVMVGDRCSTDIAAGRAAGCLSVLVLTGIDDVHAALQAPAEQQPDRIVADLRDLLRPLPAVEVSGDAAACGSSSARLVAGRIEALGPAEGAVQAALALSRARGGLPLDPGNLPRRFTGEELHDE
ncbi:HAD-IIA family hydrolase [Brevibacterium sp. 91QC2O2]|uniref:HAD-IIA family hydrolase n=1 Tax=Brevibacterium sp. 91QC2O2 TaxID=2968458 RepID=UPI00211C7AA2|nr:HAD-IIA family hydrolase [Brevibacterium sp. 91QC2O2]